MKHNKHNLLSALLFLVALVFGLTAQATVSSPMAFEGWNLVGNPWDEEATVDKDFYRMNDAGSEIIPAIGNTVNPMEGIFVHTDISKDYVTFTPNSKNAKDDSKYDASLVINLSKGNRGIVIDRAIVSAEAKGEVPVNFKAKENGEYTLTVSSTLNSKLSNLNSLHLIDNLAGADIDLLVTPSYTFNAKRDDYASRFKLVFNAQQGGEEADEDFAFISNEEIIINGTGIVQVIDLMGRIILTDEANRNISTTGFVSGVYVLRLIDGEKVKTQKILVK